MRIFVYEYVCATWRPGPATTRAASLLAEGRAMLDAALEDCRANPAAEVRALEETEHEERDFRMLADWADYALIIAPEFDQILETRCRWAKQCDATLLGASADVVALCADKLALAELWETAGVPTPPTKLFNPWSFPPPVVVKPRYGVGAIDTFVLSDRETIDKFVPKVESIVQPYLPGIDSSMSFMIGANDTIALAGCGQNVHLRNGQLQYEGGHTRQHPNIEERVRSIAELAICAVPELRGYLGVDVMIRKEGDLAIEINPRLTTSYVGLRTLSQQNLMALLIDVIEGRPTQPPTYRSNSIRFDCEGRVRSEPEA